MRHGILSLFIIFALFVTGSHALASNSGITYQGRILKPDSTPLSGAATQFKLQIRTPDSSDCLMYEEIQTLDMSHSSGSFSLTMNSSASTRTDSTGLALEKIFANQGSFTFSAPTCAGVNTYSPTSSDGRNLVVLFKDETMSTWEPIPPTKINFVPFAFEAKQVAGFSADSLLRVVNGSGDPLTGIAPLSNAEYTALVALANGSSSAYTKAGELRGTAVPALNAGEVLGWNGAAWVSQSVVGGANSVTSTMLQSGAVTSAKLDPAISISTSGTLASAVSTTRDFKIFATSPSTFYVGMLAPALSSTYTLTWPLNAGTNGQVLTTNGAGVLSWTTPPSSGITALTGDVTATGPGSVASTVASVGGSTATLVHSAELAANAATSANTFGTIVKRDGSGNFTATDITASTVKADTIKINNGGSILNIVNPVGSAWTMTLPSSAGANGQVLTTNGAGVLSWAAAATGSQWTTQAPGINYMAGNVGIGTTSPAYKLDVIGAVNATALKINGVDVGAASPSAATVTTVRVASTANLTLSGTQTIDGIAVGAGDRVLAKNQSSSSANGVYVAASGAWTRASDFSSWSQALGYTVSVLEGTVNVNQIYRSLAAPGGTLGTTSFAFAPIGGGNSYTTAMGTGALMLSTGNNNTAFGHNALYNSTTGSSNTAVGYYALPFATTGSGNTAVGDSTMYNASASYWNTAIGTSAMTSIQTGNRNVALGYQSLLQLTTGSGNIGLGYFAGSQITSGSFNVIVGSNDGAGVATTNNNIILSDGSGTIRMQVDGTGKVGIGTTSPNGKLDVKGSLVMSGSTSGYNGFQAAATAGSTVWTLPTADGTANQVLTTNGSGLLSWSTPSGGGGITSLTGDVTASGSGSVAATVANVGGLSATNVAAGATLANNASAASTNNAIVKRDGVGSFAANVATVNGVTLNNGGSLLNIVNPVGGAWTMTLPQTAGSSGQVLSTNGAGILSWINPASGGSGDFKADGTVAMTGAIQAIGGSNAAPGVSVGGTGNGLYYNGGTIGLSIGGINRMMVSTSDLWTNGLNIIAAGNIQGQLLTTGSGFGNSNVYTASGTSASLPAAATIGSGLYLENATATTGTGVFSRYTVKGGTQKAYVGAVAEGSGNTPSFVFGAQTGVSSWAERMRIDPAGNVGIGTTSPTAVLSVVGPSVAVNSNAPTVLSVQGGDVGPGFGWGVGGGISLTTGASTANFGLGGPMNFTTGIGSNGDGDITFKTGGGTNFDGIGSGNVNFNLSGGFNVNTGHDGSGAVAINLSTASGFGAYSGGQINLTAGNGGGTSGSGGSILINAGAKNGAGADGVIALANLRGNVGIGTTSPLAKLEVAGSIVSREVVIASGASVDFSQANSVVLQAPGSATINVSNMAAGGVYNLVIEDTTSRTYSFSGCGTTYWSPAAGATTNRSVYTIYRRGSSACFITWTTGFN